MNAGTMAAPPSHAPSDPGALELLHDLAALCVASDASDLHLLTGLPPYLRVHGVLAPRANYEAVTAAQMEGLARQLAGTFDASSLEKTGSVDGAYSAPDGSRFRFNIFRCSAELAIALRKLEDSFRSLADLGLPEVLYQLCDLPDGLVILCGPTGAGKTTTLATLLDRINRTRRCHMVTIEDPIEYIHKSVMSLVNQRQLGRDAPSFNDALVASLRQDPDVILVGEIRDLSTIRTAIVAAETGHLVFTTVHAGDCVGAIERMVSVFPADEQAGIRRQLSMVLRAIVTQHLIVADGSAGSNGQAPAAGVTKRSRVVTSEILMITPAVANLISNAKSNQIYSSMETGSAQGMQTLEHDLARLWMANLITESTAAAMARSPAVLRDRAALIRKPAVRPGGGSR